MTFLTCRCPFRTQRASLDTPWKAGNQGGTRCGTLPKTHRWNPFQASSGRSPGNGDRRGCRFEPSLGPLRLPLWERPAVGRYEFARSNQLFPAGSIDSTRPGNAARGGLSQGRRPEPIDVSDPEETLWLRSLVWPGDEERARLLENAVAVVQEETPEIVGGDGVALLPDMLADVPKEAALCIFRVFTNLPPTAREQFNASIANHGARRDLSVISTKRGADDGQSKLALVSYRNGVRSEALLANCQNYGKWLEWLIES